MALKISRILHAGYVFECEGTQIAFDPIFGNPFSRNCHAFPDACFDLEKIRQLKFSAVFISHFHDDHCSLESLNLLDRDTPIYLYCLFDELFDWIRALGFEKVHPLQIDVPVRIGVMSITPRRALDADVDSMFQIQAEGLNVLNVVDSWMEPVTLEKLEKFAPWDLLLWPFQTMRELEVIAPRRAQPAPGHLPEEWWDQLQRLKPRYVVPSSCQFKMEPWSWYNKAFFPISYRQFEQEILKRLPQVGVVRLNPALSVTLRPGSLERSEPLPWVLPVGDQDGDYEYDFHIQPQPTSGIARHFLGLSVEQENRVRDYCQSGLLEKFRSLDAPFDPYFAKPRNWQLSLYDHLGQVICFQYRICGSQIELLQKSQEPLGWITEVPIAKLYAALEQGESLTTMYLRINDVDFPSEIESEIRSADIVEDPLIRCLFHGVFGAYQAAQLQNILKAPTGFGRGDK